MIHNSCLKLHDLPQQDIPVLQEKHQHTLYLDLQQERCNDWNPEMEHTKLINNEPSSDQTYISVINNTLEEYQD